MIHTHFWLKRHEICSQIEGWIAELAKLQLAEKVDRSMVLRRQYRQLREELAKLPIPTGLEDLDQPFSASVQGAATAASSSSAVDLPVTPSTVSLTSESSSQSTGAESDFINITALNSTITDVNLNDMENHGLG